MTSMSPAGMMTTLEDERPVHYFNVAVIIQTMILQAMEVGNKLENLEKSGLLSAVSRDAGDASGIPEVPGTLSTINSQAVCNFKAIFRLLLFTVITLQSTNYPAFGAKGHDDYTFHIIIEDEENGKVYEITGTSEFTITPSSYSIYMNGENGRCGIHLLNFRERPVPGTYDMEQTDDITTGIVCVVQVMEPLERLASDAGSFTILEIRGNKIAGLIDVTLKGGVSEKTYRLTGKVTSEELELNLGF